MTAPFSYYRQGTRAVITGKPNRQLLPDLRGVPKSESGRVENSPEKLGSGEFDPNLVPLDFHRKTSLFDARIEGVTSRGDIKLPSMPGACHDGP
jgi:hypothetical protein